MPSIGHAKRATRLRQAYGAASGMAASASPTIAYSLCLALGLLFLRRSGLLEIRARFGMIGLNP
jgi:hypothetical protein